MGAGLGYVIEERWVRFRAEDPSGNVLRYIVGIVLVGLVFFGGRFVPDLEPWALDQSVRLVRYALVGLTAHWAAPWLFVKLRLADSELGRLTIE